MVNGKRKNDIKKKKKSITTMYESEVKNLMTTQFNEQVFKKGLVQMWPGQRVG